MKRGLIPLASIGLVAAAVAAAALVGATGPTGAKASSHREAPMIGDDPAADNTDVYAFVSPDAPSTVTLIANYIPFEDPAGGPNYYAFDPNVLYEINVDNTGDAEEDVVYQFRFTRTIANPNTFLYNTGQLTSASDPDISLRQTYTVTRVLLDEDGDVVSSTVLGSNLPVPPPNIGPRSNPSYDPYLGVQSSPARATTRSSSTSARSSISRGCARSTASTRSRSAPRRAGTACATTTRTRSPSRCRRPTS
jgi:hypothetical protein